MAWPEESTMYPLGTVHAAATRGPHNIQETESTLLIRDPLALNQDQPYRVPASPPCREF